MHLCLQDVMLDSIVIGILCIGLTSVGAISYDNVTDLPPEEESGDLTPLQLAVFRYEHPKHIGVLTTGPGAPVDLREINTINSDFATKEHMLERILHLDQEKIPERTVHAKGAGAFGYFEVTHDVSEYISSDVFNGIGKKTPVVVRFSPLIQRQGGLDLVRETIGFAIKFYTKEGNLDLVGLNIPVFFRDPIDFPNFVHAFQRNPKTFTFDFNSRFEFVTNRPASLNMLLWALSDYGLPKGFRKINGFAVHTFQVYNKRGDRFLVKFNFRSNQGLANFTNEEARGRDPDYSIKDLYSSIEIGNYPSWTLELYVLPEADVEHLRYNPYELSKTWEEGTYKVVTVGQLVLNRNPGNYIRDVEQTSFNPANLVPGIAGAFDPLYLARRVSYRDSQNYRLGINHEKIQVNQPLYPKTYDRNGVPPALDNMGDAPPYYPNSFNGPEPFIDQARPSDLTVVVQSNAYDLQDSADLLNVYMAGEGHRNRLAGNIATALQTVYPAIVKRALRLFGLISPDLLRRILIARKRMSRDEL